MNSCGNCGKCCEYLVLPILHDADRKLFRLRDIQIIDGYAYVPFKCKHYDPEKKCLIYENRPDVCREFKIDSIGCKLCKKI